MLTKGVEDVVRVLGPFLNDPSHRRTAPQVGRDALRRCAFAQGRQAFRRARAAMPEKLLLKRGQDERRGPVPSSGLRRLRERGGWVVDRGWFSVSF